MKYGLGFFGAALVAGVFVACSSSTRRMRSRLMDLDQATAEIVDSLVVGAPVSVYATVGNGVTDSAHLIHRNDPNEDGAIVANPTSASPTFLLFHFDEQTFWSGGAGGPLIRCANDPPPPRLRRGSCRSATK